MGTRMTIDPELKNTHKTLSIQVRLDGFSFYIKSEPEQELKDAKSFPFEGSLNPEQCLVEIKRIVEDEDLLDLNYDEIKVTYYNELYTLVPEALFDEEKSADYLKYTTKILSTDYLAHDLVDQLGIVCVYIPFTNINNYFFECFGSFEYLHAITLAVGRLLSNSKDTEGAQMHVFLRAHNFDLIAYQGSHLQLCNTFDHSVPEDMAYHILFCYEQLGFDLNKDMLNIHGILEKESDTYKLLYTYVRNINVIPEDSWYHQN